MQSVETRLARLEREVKDHGKDRGIRAVIYWIMGIGPDGGPLEHDPIEATLIGTGTKMHREPGETAADFEARAIAEAKAAVPGSLPYIALAGAPSDAER